MKNWWKYLCILLLFYTVIMGFKGSIPELNILEESIRNLYFHVPMWFAMMTLMLVSVVYSIRYLSKQKIEDDIKAAAFAKVGFLFGFLGILTGAVWARATWGAWWVFQEVKARFSAVYSIFAFVMFMVLINVIPRISNSSLHPGNGGNPGFNSYDLDSNLRLVFYPAVLGWILLSVWIATLLIRVEKIFRKKHGLDLEESLILPVINSSKNNKVENTDYIDFEEIK